VGSSSAKRDGRNTEFLNKGSLLKILQKIQHNPFRGGDFYILWGGVEESWGSEPVKETPLPGKKDYGGSLYKKSATEMGAGKLAHQRGV